MHVCRFTAEYVSRCVLGVHSKALASVLCLLLRRARLDLHAEVEQKEIGESRHRARPLPPSAGNTRHFPADKSYACAALVGQASCFRICM